jgi:hypothetical protein
MPLPTYLTLIYKLCDTAAAAFPRSDRFASSINFETASDLARLAQMLLETRYRR